MTEVVEYSTSKLNENDLHAIAGYLKRLPAAGLDAARSYILNSADEDGRGDIRRFLCGLSPSSGRSGPSHFCNTQGQFYMQARDPLNVIRLILEGQRASTTDARPTPFKMPAFAWKLDDNKVAADCDLCPQRLGQRGVACKTRAGQNTATRPARTSSYIHRNGT